MANRMTLVLGYAVPFDTHPLTDLCKRIEFHSSVATIDSVVNRSLVDERLQHGSPARAIEG